MWDYANVEAELSDFDACFFCIGVTSSGMSEQKYTHLTYDMTLAVATTLARLNPQMVFVYVSGAGADSSETSRVMWERVRGKTENALLKLPFRGVYIFRPGMIQPVGVQVEDDVVPLVLFADQAAAAGAARDAAGPDPEYAASGPGDAGGGAPRRAQARAGKPRHQRLEQAPVAGQALKASTSGTSAPLLPPALTMPDSVR